MLSYFLEFFGFNIENVTPEVLSICIPVLIAVGSVFTFYVFVSFFQFILKLLDRRG